MGMAEGLVQEFEHELGSTLKEIERVTDAIWTWKPHEKSMSVQQLVSHLAEVPAWGVSMVNDAEYNMVPGEYKPLVCAGRKEAVDTLNANAKAFMEALKGKGDDVLFQPWAFKVNGQTQMELPRVAALRGWTYNHMVHHRAQLGVYLRLNDIPVPAIYGPSADENPFMP